MPPRATFRDVFAVREFRALWFSEILSVAGDRLALVALTLLVYDRTKSPLLTAMTYAAGYLPSVTDTQLTPLLTLPGGQYPALSQTVLGSYAQVSLTSWLHPPTAGGAPGFSGVGRLVGWTLTPPSAQQAETTQIQLGGLTLTGDPGNVDISS